MAPLTSGCDADTGTRGSSADVAEERSFHQCLVTYNDETAAQGLQDSPLLSSVHGSSITRWLLVPERSLARVSCAR